MKKYKIEIRRDKALIFEGHLTGVASTDARSEARERWLAEMLDGWAFGIERAINSSEHTARLRCHISTITDET